MIATPIGVELDSETYHQESETHRFKYDQETVPPSMAVVAALSEVVDRDPMELEPLHEYLDADALDELVRVRGTTDGDISVTVTREEYTITVHSYGTVSIAPLRHDRSDTSNEDGARK